MVRPRQFSDEEILTAARTVFLESGPSVSTTVIAQRLGLSQAALFKRFGTKDDLMVQALTTTGPFPFADRAGPDEREIVVQLKEMADELTAFLARIVPCTAMLRAAKIPPEQAFAHFDVPPPMVVRGRLIDWLAEARNQGRIRDGVELDHVALAFMGAMHIRCFLEHIGRGHLDKFALPEPESYRETVAQMAWSMLAPDA